MSGCAGHPAPVKPKDHPGPLPKRTLQRACARRATNGETQTHYTRGVTLREDRKKLPIHHRARRDVAICLLPEVSDFPNAAFLEFSWGDREYYTAKEQPTIDTLARAGLTATPAVMHVVGRAEDSSGRPAIRGTEIITLALSQPEFRRLVDAIAWDFERHGGLRSAPISAGLTRSSFFYHAKGEFHLFNTCNTWIADKLTAGGIDLSSSGIVTANDLMRALRSAIANE